MDEIDCFGNEVQSEIITNNSNCFDKVVDKEPVNLRVYANHISYLTPSGTSYKITLDSKDRFYRAIFKACLSGFKSEWFSGISDQSKRLYFDTVRLFFYWINKSKCKQKKENNFLVLKEFEAYRMNVEGLKKSPLEILNVVVKKGLSCRFLSRSELEYLETLLSYSTPNKSSESVQITLSSWFDICWLRHELGESTYFKLDSPRLLFQSFRVTIATTLLWIQEQRKYWKKFPTLTFDNTVNNWTYVWNRKLFEHVSTVGIDGGPNNDFNELLWLDLVKPTAREILKEKLSTSPSIKLPYSLYYGRNKNPPWKKPVFFHPDYQTEYSPIEEMLCAWLAACEAIQPSDIKKLKKSNYAREYNRHGRLLAMECTYYKGRSGTTKQPAILLGNEPWTRAMEVYLNGLSGASLFKTNVTRAWNLLLSASVSRNKAINLVYGIWELPSFVVKLNEELKINKSSSLFLQAMLGLKKGSSIAGGDRIRNSIKELQETVPNPLQRCLFSLTHIKTTAVHAGSDKYRSNDLVNHHSHSSLTEKTAYLTDQNKEWVNQSGRITRLVIHDLQSVVFKPSIVSIINAVKEMDLRTRIVEETNSDEAREYPLNGESLRFEDEGDLIVHDSTDTAIYFLHYISQAEIMLPELIRVRPDWVERTLVIQVEWMSLMLTRMHSTVTARKYYKKLAEHLPQLFIHIMDSTE